MTNILKFPERPEEMTGREFLQDGDDILRFDSPRQEQDRPAFSPPQEPDFLEHSRNKDWSNQELADLFRVKRLLDSARVANEVDRGVTDEGDPWFLFCDGNGEVFIHLCRLDGVYILDSPSIAQPLRGQDFNALVDQFIARRSAGTDENPGATTGHRVVRLERDGKVFLHPSTMLTALVWTLIMASEDLVMLMPDGAAPDAPDLAYPPETAAGSAGQDQVLAPLAPSPDSDAPFDGIAPGRATMQTMRDPVIAGESKTIHNNYIAGLSAIAISLGFMSQTRGPADGAMTLENMLAFLSGRDPSRGQGETGLDGLGLDQDETRDFLATLADVFDTIGVMIGGRDTATGTDADSHVYATLLDQVEDFLKGDDPGFAAIADNIVPPGPQRPEADTTGLDSPPPARVGLPKDAPDAQAAGDAQQVTRMLSKFGLENTVQTPEAALREYVVGNETVVATFDVDARKLERTDDLIATSLETDGPATTPGDAADGDSAARGHFQAYDHDAYLFISHLMSKGSDIEMIAADGELILLDPDVFEPGASETFAISWSLENGEIISAIGLKSDYESFDLIA